MYITENALSFLSDHLLMCDFYIMQTVTRKLVHVNIFIITTRKVMPRAVAAPFSRPLSKSNEKSNACLQYVCKSVKLFTLTALKL